MVPLARMAGCRYLVTLGERRDGTLLEAATPFDDAFHTVRRAAGDLAAILYTSGTTGRSKGAMLTHGNLASNALTLDEAWGFAAVRAAGGQDVLLHALPLFHVHGLFVASHAALLAGARMLFIERFEPRLVLERLPRTTVFMGVPTYYTRLLAEDAFDRRCCGSMGLGAAAGRDAPRIRGPHRPSHPRALRHVGDDHAGVQSVLRAGRPAAGRHGRPAAAGRRRARGA
jgi:malonyl-CoA/methylmalonyl-CoA synthetase